MRELNALLYSLCSVAVPPPQKNPKALFLCKPSHPTDTPGLVCALHLLLSPPLLLLRLSSPLRTSQPGLPLPGRICNAAGSCGRRNLQPLRRWHSSQRPRAEQRQRDPGRLCNHSADLSREGTARVALPAGWPPFLSSLPFLLPRGSLLAPQPSGCRNGGSNWEDWVTHVPTLELLSRAAPRSSLLPADQRYPTCLPWALCLCRQLSLPAGCPKEGGSVLLTLGTPIGTCRRAARLDVPPASLMAGSLLGERGGKLPAAGRETSPGDSGRIQPC